MKKLTANIPQLFTNNNYMGQYYKNNKIGTCEMMYYLRLNTAKKLAQQNERDDDGIPFRDYVTDDITKFRFPFPSEDGKELLTISNHAPTVRFQAFNLNLDHGNMCLSTGNTNNINVFIPCVYSQNFKDLVVDRKISSSSVGTQYIDVLMQAVRMGRTRTVFQCPQCKNMAWFTEDDISKWKEQVSPLYAPSEFDDDTSKTKKIEMLEIINRIS